MMVTKNSVIRDIEFFLPEDWTIKVLGEISDVRDGTHDSPKYLENGYPLITSKNLKTNGLDFKNVNFISEEDHYKISERSKVDTGDILFGMIGTLGNPVIVKEDDGQFSIKNVALIKFNNSILNNVFLKNLLNSTFIEKIFNRISDGGVQKFIALGTIRKLPIPLPPLKEQQKIATILSSVDEAIKKTEEIINQIQNVKKGLMHQLLTRGIGKNEYKNTIIGVIPDNWEVKSLGEMIEENIIISHLDGNHGSLYPRADEFVQEGIPYISANSLNNGKVEFKNAKYLSLERANKIKKGIAKDKDVLFAHNATVGPVAVLETDLEFVILSTTLTYYRCNKELINPYYLSYYLQSSKFVNQYSRVMAQSTRNQVPITTQRKFQHVIPPLDEQNVIVEIMESIDSKLLNENNKLVELRNIKQGLMQQLLTGKVRVSINEEVPQ